ncbi:hypothetical protein ABIA35_009117 [Catenulispora sp. MAP12-49]|uniref:hypothetical protein n=1 Tax=Catenulispora sp. MAP12-49 TaxID=3156302 RepID=UPI0035181087
MTGAQDEGKAVRVEELTREKLIRAVRDYQRLEQWVESEDRRRFREMAFEQAVALAGEGRRANGTYHPHLEAKPGRPLTSGRKNALTLFRDRLTSETVRHEIRSATCFDDIHHILEREARNVRDVGAVTVYDAAVSIGANRGYEPEQIYLHADPGIGARALIRGLSKDRISVEELPEAALEILKDYKLGDDDFTAGEIEDILCRFGGLQ